MQALFETGGSIADVTRSFAEEWLARLQREAKTRADAEGIAPREFACTLLAAVVGEDAAVFLQIGDGVIIVSTDEEPDYYGYVFWPQKGEYENQTYFATDPSAASHFEHCYIPKRVNEVALLSDGLQRLALRFQQQEVHAPFFRPIFGPVRGAPAGHSTELSRQLETFLASPHVCSRTDDDKTLIVATRLPRDEVATGDRVSS